MTFIHSLSGLRPWQTLPALAGLIVACTAATPEASTVAASHAAPTGAPTASAYTAGASAAQRVYVDPKTGAFISPPSGDVMVKEEPVSAGEVTTRTTATGVTLVRIPSAVQGVCATKAPADAPGAPPTITDCQNPPPPSAGARQP